jgi:hypothetical protein
LRFAPEEINTTRRFMRIRLLRAFFTITTLAVVWFVASPALAANAPVSMVPPADTSTPSTPSTPSLARPSLARPSLARAPLCDPRGATTFAPPPQMQDVEVSLDTGLTLDDCMSPSRHNDAYRAAPGRTPLLDAPASSDAAVLTAVPALVAPMRELMSVPVASTECPRPGVRSTVDRPPRA